MNETILKHLLSSIELQLKSIQTSLDAIKTLCGDESTDTFVGSSIEERKNNILEIKLEDFVQKIESAYEPEYLED